ncbi:hypothetical protein MUP77_17865 [Candidatus Bathyarchaeota archaeon]|nr:hypothetical protein [Candidatus Bathyarchaeota archaeon]
MSKLWHSRPVYTTVVEILQKKQGSVTDIELYKALKDDCDDLSFIAFNKALMTLEIRGIIHVYNLTKSRRGIEIIKS